MPSTRTIRDWQEGKVESVPATISADIARAREIGYDAIANRARETARGKGDSTKDVQRDKLIIETDLKLLSKWSKRYNDRITVAGDADNPLHFALARKLDEANKRRDELGRDK